MEKQLDKLLNDIRADYRQWWVRSYKGDPNLPEHTKKMIQEFNNSLTYEIRNKYIKIIKQNSVWGFIVNTDTDKKFKRGDILKAASWNAPTRNKPRGNIFENYQITWTGPLYL